MEGALRHLLRPWPLHLRSALPMLRFWLVLLGVALLPGATLADSDSGPKSAEFAEPTTRYDHGILGDAVEWGALILRRGRGDEGPAAITLRLPKSRVFEDTAPRLFKDAAGQTKVMVVETDMARGARLSIYSFDGLVTATPYIGRTHRWLAPIGARDLDGDGQIEVAYIDRPHLAKTLRIWRLVDGQLAHVTDQSGLTNHRIGWDYIPGGIRDCGQGPEMITANADISRVIASTLRNGRVTMRDIGRYDPADRLTSAMACK